MALKARERGQMRRKHFLMNKEGTIPIFLRLSISRESLWMEREANEWKVIYLY